MTLEKIRRRLRLLRSGLTTVAAIYRQDRNPRRLAGTIWFVTTREGLIGLRQWLIRTAPPGSLGLPPAPDVVIAAPEAEAQRAALAMSLSPAATAEQLYGAWLERYDLLREPEVEAARCHLTTLDLPDLLILAVVRASDLPAVDRIVASWQAQLHRRWRAAIVTSPDLSADETHLLRAATADDPRLSVVTTPAEIAAAQSRVDFILLSFGTTLLHGLSAYMFLEAAIRTGAAIVYSDHDRLRDDGTRTDPSFKPQFSPEYLARYNYIGDCLLLSRVVPITPEDTVSLPRLTLADYDELVARLVLTTPRLDRHVEHVPFPLFHVLSEQPRAPHRTVPNFADTGPTVAIIIPTRDGLEHLRHCIDSILGKTSYDLDRLSRSSSSTIIRVDPGDARLPGGARRTCPGSRSLPYPHPFNFADHQQCRR